MSKKDNRTNSYDDYSYRAADTPPSYGQTKQRRKMKKSARRALVLLVAVALMLGMAWVVTSLLQRNSRSDISNIPAPSQPEVSLPTSVPPASSEADLPPVVAGDTAWNTASPVQADAQAVINPDRRMLALPENGRVDMSYFDTAVFVGDSITQGLQLYKEGIPNAHYCAYKGASPRAIYSGEAVRRADGESEIPLDAVRDYQPDNIYILLGTNAMVSMDDESLLAYYGEMIDTMKAGLHPEINYYIQSITPVLQGVDPRFDMDRINGLNDQLAKLAVEKGCYFVNLNEALAGDDGWMRSDYGAKKDGYHMTPSGYAAWVEYLVTHTAYNRRHAHLYQEGTHYYSQLAPPAES